MTAKASTLRCENLFEIKSPFVELPSNLREVYGSEPNAHTAEAVAELNKQTLENLENYKPVQSGKRAAEITYQEANRLHQSMHNHRVVGYNATANYNRPDVSIGYCFGRATYAHLMLLKMGMQKESVLKIWAVGEMKSPSVMWDFHVATLVNTAQHGWMAIDPNFSNPTTVSEWVQKYKSTSTDQLLRFYVTPAEKFSFEIGKYDRAQLGLDMERKADWYRHYFVDLIKSVRETKIDNLSAQQFNPKNDSIKEETKLSQAVDYLKRFLGLR
ncbi:MAG: hypothetical protein H7328_06265 [Bdellovibrio sp.]|nr:hypothetical protein [Bdellovibrio sp.]